MFETRRGLPGMPETVDARSSCSVVFIAKRCKYRFNFETRRPGFQCGKFLLSATLIMLLVFCPDDGLFCNVGGDIAVFEGGIMPATVSRDNRRQLQYSCSTRLKAS